MKLLRNPIVVTLLAVLAGIYSVWTLLGARGFRSHLATAATSGAHGPAVPVPLSTSEPTTAPPADSPPEPRAPARAIDYPSVAGAASRWIESPRRDPFLLDRPRPDSPSGPTASEVLTLRAIWRQTGSQLAVINQQILREGDRLQGFAVETIEAQGVWVRGTNGRERITFSIPNIPQRPAVVVAAQLDNDGPIFQETITATLPIAPTP